jgi:hypothetical protein
MSIITGMFMLMRSYKGKAKKGPTGKGTQKALIPTKVYIELFEKLHRFFLTKNSMEKLYKRISELSIYSYADLKIVTVRFYVISMSAAIATVIAGIITFRDVFSVLLCVAFAVVIKVTLVDKQIDSIHFKLLKQLSLAISSLRQNYLRFESIPEAISYTETGPLIKRSFEEIYLILTATNDEIRLQEFYAATPFKLLQTLAGVCYKLNSCGDTVLQNGTSNFVQAMSMMSSEVNLEIRRISLQRARFGMLEILPLAPLGAVGIIQRFFSGVIPGTVIIYNGIVGYITRICIILSAMIGYVAIVKINSAVTIKIDDRTEWTQKLLLRPKFKNFIETIVPKKLRKISRKKKLLGQALSRNDINTIYTKKVVYSVVALVAALVATFFIVNLSKDFIYDNVAELSLIGGESLDKDGIKIRKKMDEIYLSKPKMSEKQTLQFVEGYLPKLQEYDKQAQVRRLQLKYDKYYGTYFKWWMILICNLIAILAWFAPEVGLRARKWLLRTEAEEDVLQMQTIIAILMNTTSDTLDILFWMQRQSRVHKNALLEAYHEYPSNPELAMNRLKSKSSLVEFKRIVDKLILTIHQISIQDAFGDLISEREHILRIREIAQVSAISKKRQVVSPLSMAPLIITAIGYILLPIGILGYQEFTNAMSNMGF